MNKTIITTLLLCMIMFSFASAWTSDRFIEDTEKISREDTTTKYGTYEIIDHKWWDILKVFTEEVVKEVTLERNTDSCGDDCEAEKQITLHKEGSLIDTEGVRFYRVFEDGSMKLSNIRSYQVLLKTDETEYEENVYEYICEATGEVSKNGTIIQECSNVLTGTITRTTPEWINYELGSILPAGTYTIKLIGSKRPDWVYDWQIRINGVWTTEWAIWGASSLTEGLVSYYNFDEPSGNLIDLKGLNNATPTATLTYSQDGIVNKSIKADGSNGRFNFANNNLLTTDNTYTYAMWFKRNDDNTFHLFGANSNSGTRGFNIGFVSGNLFCEVTGKISASYTWTANNDWNYIVCLGNSTGIYQYLNNNLVATAVGDSVPVNPTTTLRLYNRDSEGSFDRPFDGNIDEFGYWNRTLTSDELTMLYNSGAGTTYPFVDGTITLNSPANNSISNSAEVTFNATASVTGGAYLTNMSFCSNITGSWGCGDTINTSGILAGSDNNPHNQTINILQSTGSRIQGVQITPKRDLYLWNVTKDGTSNPTGCSLYWQNQTLIKNGTFVGNICELNISLSASGVYWIMAHNSGSNWNGYRSGETGGLLPKIAGSLTWNATSADSGAFDLRTSIVQVFTQITTSEFANVASSTQTWSKTIPAGSTLWNVQACDSDGDCGFSVANYTVSLDATAPTIFVNAGNGTQNYGTLTQNHTINFTATDTNLDTVIFNYNGTNRTLSGVSSGVEYSFNFSLVQGLYNLTLYANDTAGNVQTQLVTWNYLVFENEQTYEPVVFETQLTNFAINITYVPSASLTATLNYDGENYTSINTGSGSQGIFTTPNFNIPLINGTTEKTFFWYLNYGGAVTLTEELNQTITPLTIIQCNGTFPVRTLNFTFYDELSQQIINGANNKTTFLFNIKYWLGDGSIKKDYAFQNLSSSLNSYVFCIGQNITYKADVDAQFFAEGYEQRTYYLREANISNETKFVTLYNILTSEANKFTVRVRQGTAPFTNAIVNVYKYFVGLNEHRLVLVGLTDEQGRFPASVKLDQNYIMEVYKDLTHYGNFSRESICATLPCEIEINIEETILNPLDPFYAYFAQNIDYNITRNDTTQILTLNFVDITGTAQYWRLLVTKSFLNNETIVTICDESVFSPSGSITCNFTGVNGDLNARVYISRSPEKLVVIYNWLNSLDYKTFGASAILVTIIILLVMFFAGINNPVNALVMIPFALVILKFIQMMPLNWSWILGLTIVLYFWIIPKLNT